MADSIQQSARALDLSPRMVATTTVVASPALAAETIIASLTIPANLAVMSGVQVFGWAAFTVGTSGTTSNIKIRQTGTSGSTVAATGVLATAAATLNEQGAQGFDTAPVGAQVYVLTLTVANGGAVSTVSAVSLFAIVV